MKQKAKITFTKSEKEALLSSICYFNSLVDHEDDVTKQPAMMAEADALERAYEKIGEYSNYYKRSKDS